MSPVFNHQCGPRSALLFNSWTFWRIVLVVRLAYWLLPFRWRNVFLVDASYVFDGSWGWRAVVDG